MDVSVFVCPKQEIVLDALIMGRVKMEKLFSISRIAVGMVELLNKLKQREAQTILKCIILDMYRLQIYPFMNKNKLKQTLFDYSST